MLTYTVRCIRVPCKISVHSLCFLPSYANRWVQWTELRAAIQKTCVSVPYLKLVLCTTQVHLCTPRNEEITWRYVSPKFFYFENINLSIYTEWWDFVIIVALSFALEETLIFVIVAVFYFKTILAHHFHFQWYHCVYGVKILCASQQCGL